MNETGKAPLLRPNHRPTLYLLTVLTIAILGITSCKGHTHITGTVTSKWGSPIYPAQITLRQGERVQQVQASRDGKFDIAMDHAPFKVELKLIATSSYYNTVEKNFSSSAGLKTIDITMEEAPEPTVAEVRKLLLKGVSVNEAKKLAELMCRQLPNAAAFPVKSFMSGDDVHDTLVLLSSVAQPCLVDHLADATWMPDSRSEPLADFHAGDAALWILTEAGLDWDKVVTPLLDPKKQESIGVFAYFDWVNKGNHRKVVQQAVKRWLQEHPECCGTEKDFINTPETATITRISPPRLAELQQAWPRLRAGMDEKIARQLLGPPDVEADLLHLGGVASLNRYEKTAAFYFIETRSNAGKPDFRHRDFVRDRYLIIFFSENGKFVRAFSNVPEFAAIFPRSEKLWSRIIYASMAARQ